MISDARFLSLASRLWDFEPSAFPGPVDEKTILEAERELGTGFPFSYRWFLKTFGAADFPLEIFGLEPETRVSKEASFWDVVYITESEREEVEPHLPAYLIPFNPDGAGNHYCLDTSKMANSECPVVFWVHDADREQQPKQTHFTFFDWLEEHITSVEQYDL